MHVITIKKMKIETRLDFKSYIKLMFSLTYKKPIMIFIIIYLLVVLVMAIFIFSDLKFLFGETYDIPLFLAFYIIIALPILIYFNARKNFSTNGLIKEKIIYEFTDDKICHTGETFYSEKDWTKVYKIVEMKHWILIYQSRQIANLIPKESFGDNLMEFRNLVRSKKIKAKLK